MGGLFNRAVFTFTVIVLLTGSAWGGWFSFEPNLILRDGAPVARYLEDLEEELAYLSKGDTAQADQMVKDMKVYMIKEGQDMTRVEFKSYQEDQGEIFIQVQDESGTKIWANMKNIACLDQNGQKKDITKQDVVKGEFKPLP